MKWHWNVRLTPVTGVTHTSPEWAGILKRDKGRETDGLHSNKLKSHTVKPLYCRNTLGLVHTAYR